ncbi:hypothetical protein BDW74DRAFT_53809 [Aspergillus multicolor]|uniref:pinin family protein n=1 Tax=Aspergillus multicolor TaxID=41759 RepID=UPI003CCE1E6D
MAEATLASAVIVPEDNASPEAGQKRRQSSTTDLDSDIKRRRLSTQSEDRSPKQARRQSSPKQDSQDTERKRNRRDEERKRGQRLFGSLLGTLSQSSTSAAQRRRADIERKQQDKLKIQDEEYGELKKKRREERLATRKKEQKAYEKEMMHTRHTNLLAMAHFLKTKSEPVLYYKPWQLRPEEEDIIRDQVREAEVTVSREVDEFDVRNAQEDQPEAEKQAQPEEKPEEQPEQSEPSLDAQGDKPEEQKDSVTAETNHEKEPEETKPDSAPAEAVPATSHQEEDHRGAEDDGGEVVEDNEDTVIY